MKMNHTKHQRMTYEDTVTAAQAIEACAMLSAFLVPVLRDTHNQGGLEGAAFLSGMIADLGALREALRSMMVEDRVLQ